MSAPEVASQPDPSWLTELSDRMASQLEATRGRLSRAWIILVLLAAVFFAFGFAPYVVNRAVVLRILESQVESVAAEARLRRDRVPHEQWRARFESLATKLRDQRRSLLEELEVRLRARETPMSDYAVHAELVKEEADFILRNPWPFSSRLPISPGLRDRIERHLEDYYELGAGDAEAWRKNSFGDVFRSARQQNNYVWEGAAAVVDEHRREVDGKISEIDRQLNEIKEQRRRGIEEITGRSERLAEVERMTELDTPAGDVPIPLTELTLWFPLVATVGFWSVWARQRRWDRQRLALVALWRRRDPDGSVLTAAALDEAGLGTGRWMGLVYTVAPVLALAAAGLFAGYASVFSELCQAGRLGVVEHLYTLLVGIAALGAAAAVVVIGLRQREVDSSPR